MDITKEDWKVFRSKLPGWQEHYMEKLVEQYRVLLNDDTLMASTKFWELDKRIRADRKDPGVILEVRRSTVFMDIAYYLKYNIICEDDLDGFSEELKQYVHRIVKAYSDD